MFAFVEHSLGEKCDSSAFAINQPRCPYQLIKLLCPCDLKYLDSIIEFDSNRVLFGLVLLIP